MRQSYALTPYYLKHPTGLYIAPVYIRLFALFPLRNIQFRLSLRGLRCKSVLGYRFAATGGTDYSSPLYRGFLFLQINGLSPPLVTACLSPCHSPRPCLFLSVVSSSACRTRAGRNLQSEDPSIRQAQSFGLCICMRF